jgi:hypothetical protein
MAWRRLRVSLVLVLLAACGNTGGPTAPPISNPILERWCEFHPCGWETQGDFEKVGTWHPDDYALELLGAGAEVSQLRAELDAGHAKCFEFSLMVKVSANARAYLELDFLDDGVHEFSERIPKSEWEVRKFTIATPTWYEGVRFRVRREGDQGRVVVAEFYVEQRNVGCSATPLELLDRPSGASCELDEECSGGHCSEGTCD